MKQIMIIEASNEDELADLVNGQLAILTNPTVVGFCYSPTGYHCMIQYEI